METKRRYEHPTSAAGTAPAAVSPERALRVFTQPERNPGIPLDLDLVRALRINRSAVERRAATIPTRRTVKKEWQAAWLLRAITCIDLTTLQGDDTPSNVLRLCAKAKSPVRADLLAALGATDIGITVGAVCVYHAFVPLAVEALQGSGIPVAAVSTGFPAGLNPLRWKHWRARGSLWPRSRRDSPRGSIPCPSGSRRSKPRSPPERRRSTS